MATLAYLYEQKGENTLQKILVNAKAEVFEGYEHDNLDGGIDGHQVRFIIPEIIFFDVFDKIDDIARELCTGLNKVNTSIKNEYFCDVLIEKEDVTHSEWRKDSGLLLDETHVVPESIQKRIWQPEMFRLFISHKTEDKIKVATLKTQLKVYGVDCFVAHEDIEPNTRWADEIENALFSMDACIAIMTQNYHDSFWTDHEVGCAYGRHVPVLAVRMGKDPYGLIGRFQGLSSTWEDLPMKTMIYLLQYTQAKDSFVTAVKNCDSYDHGNMLAKLFPEIKSLSEKQLDRLIDAWITNSQARDSYGFNGGKTFTYGEGIRHYILQWDSKRFPNIKDIDKYCDNRLENINQ